MYYKKEGGSWFVFEDVRKGARFDSGPRLSPFVLDP